MLRWLTSRSKCHDRGSWSSTDDYKLLKQGFRKYKTIYLHTTKPDPKVLSSKAPYPNYNYNEWLKYEIYDISSNMSTKQAWQYFLLYQKKYGSKIEYNGQDSNVWYLPMSYQWCILTSSMSLLHIFNKKYVINEVVKCRPIEVKD